MLSRRPIRRRAGPAHAPRVKSTVRTHYSEVRLPRAIGDWSFTHIPKFLVGGAKLVDRESSRLKVVRGRLPTCWYPAERTCVCAYYRVRT